MSIILSVFLISLCIIAYALKKYDLLLFLLVLSLFGDIFDFQIGVGNEVVIPLSLSFQFAIFVIINTWTSIFSFFVSGIGKIGVSLYNALIQFIITIPLAIFLAKYMDLSTTGIILAINISLLIPAIILVIQTNKIINKKAFGIWNK